MSVRIIQTKIWTQTGQINPDGKNRTADWTIASSVPAQTTNLLILLDQIAEIVFSKIHFKRSRFSDITQATGFWYFVIFNLDLAWWNYTIRMSVNWRERVLIFSLSRLKCTINIAKTRIIYIIWKLENCEYYYFFENEITCLSGRSCNWEKY